MIGATYYQLYNINLTLTFQMPLSKSPIKLGWASSLEPINLSEIASFPLWRTIRNNSKQCGNWEVMPWIMHNPFRKGPSTSGLIKKEIKYGWRAPTYSTYISPNVQAEAKKVRPFWNCGGAKSSNLSINSATDLETPQHFPCHALVSLLRDDGTWKELF